MSDAPATGTTFDRVTTAHSEVERWVRERGGRPAEVPGSESGVGFRFPGDDAEGEPIDWDAFFERFEDANLALAYDSNAGEAAPEDACALVERDRAEEVAREPPAEAEEADTPERVGEADSDREAEQRSLERETDAREQSNVDNHRDEPPFES